nr:CHASE4 domain-containing protein [Leptolyngbya sp. CCY15150]
MVGVFYVAASTILLRAIEQAEEQSNRQTIQSVLNVLGQEKEDFDQRFADWAAWDDTYQFVQDRNQAYIESNLPPEGFADIRLNLGLIVNSAGEVVYGTGFDLERNQFTPVPEAVQRRLVLGDRLMQHPEVNSSLSGILMVPDGAMLISSRPIVTSARQGPIQGTLIAGRLLDDVAVARLSGITHLPIDLRAVNDSNLPTDFQQARAALSAQNPFFFQNRVDGAIDGYTLINDIDDQPAVLLRVELPRDIYNQGKRSVLSLIGAIILTGLIFGVVTLLLLQRLVISRVDQLSANVRRIGAKRDFSLRAHVSGHDELLMLATDVNIMLEALEESQQEISRQNQVMSVYIQQVEQVTEAAAAVESNTFKPEQLNDVAARTDKVGQLARVFTHMVQTVEAREQELKDSKQQLSQQNDALIKLTHSKTLSQGDWLTAVQEITTVAAQSLTVERTSVWLYGQEKTKLNCADLYELSVNRHSQGLDLRAEDYPTYFQALETDQIIATHDAYKDPRLVEFREVYLEPLGIMAMLDAPIRSGGETIGVLCLEQVGTPHVWTVEEQGFVRSLADLVALAIEAHQRQQAEEALRIALENYRGIYEQALEGIFQSTPEGRFINVNPAMASIYNYDSAEEMVAVITDIEQQIYVDPESRDEFKQRLEQGDQVTGFEYRTYQKDGDIIWISESTRAVRGNNGKLLYYEGIIQDITDRKRREDELRRQLEELKIEIDQKKREKEVATLTESTYFQEVRQEVASINLDEFWS